jgi:hypothetical protein
MLFSQVLTFSANFEIATALISPTHYCRIITAPVYNIMVFFASYLF